MHQVNSKNNCPVLLFKTIFIYLEILKLSFLTSVAKNSSENELHWKLKKLGQPFQVLMLCLQKSLKSDMVIAQMFAPDVTLSVNARLAIRKRAGLLEANTLPQRKTYTDP